MYFIGYIYINIYIHLIPDTAQLYLYPMCYKNKSVTMNCTFKENY